MSSQEDIREEQKKSWNKFSSGWKKWDELTMDFLRPVGLEMIRHINPSGNQTILDIAGGTGEPGLSIASMLNEGTVMITDLAEDMLAITNDKARDRNISNIDTRVCDVSDLSFENNYFDAVSCRFGFMFFPDMQVAANEMFRVLSPGGKMAISVWDIPEKNFWVTAIMGTIMKHIDVPPNPSGAPGMFRCSKPGMMTEILKVAGFQNIVEKETTTFLNCGTTHLYWEMMTDIGAPIVAALGKADEKLREQIRIEVEQLVAERHPEGLIKMPASAVVITANK